MYMNDNTGMREAAWHRQSGPSVLDSPPDIVEFLPLAIYACDRDERVVWCNRNAAALLGATATVGDRHQFSGALRLCSLDGRPLEHAATPMARALARGAAVRGERLLVERPDGSQRICTIDADPVLDRRGAVIGVINSLNDVSDLLGRGDHDPQTRADERQKALTDELNHRVRNTLAAVQCLAAQMLPRAGVPSPAFDAFAARLLALSRTHDELSAASWQATDLSTILTGAFAPGGALADGRVAIDGPAVRVLPRTALALAAAVHELASNAARHGSLSVTDGRLSLSWRVVEAGRVLSIEWVETGGPPAAPPLRPGFGNRLLQRSVRDELNGTVTTSHDPSGYRCSIRVPLA